MKDYFSHDYNSRNDKKLVNIFMKYGLEAIGAYWCIVEMLYEEFGYLPISEYERITFELRTNEKLIKYLIFDSELFNNDGIKFWSDTAIERLKLRSEKSEKARKSIEYRWNKESDTNVLQSNEERNTNKVNESKEKQSKGNIEIDEIYNLYPSNCPVKNSSTGKSLKCKDKIKSLLISKSKDEIISIITRYTKECMENKIYMKNFSTFLNNLPDYSQTPQQSVSKNRMVHYRMLGREHTHYEKAYFENLQSLGSEQVQFLNYVEDGN